MTDLASDDWTRNLHGAQEERTMWGDATARLVLKGKHHAAEATAQEWADADRAVQNILATRPDPEWATDRTAG